MNIDEDIKIYFKDDQWDKLSELEKVAYRNAYNTYQECLMLGIVLPEPDFMVSNQENGCETVHNVKDIKDIPLTDCKEENPLTVDADICNLYYGAYEEELAVRNKMVLHILDNTVLKGTKDRAKKTLPEHILDIKASPIHEEGVFALKTIPEGINFGPYDGLKPVQTTTGYAWKIIDGKLVDLSKVESSNWMRYVNCARNIHEQNLISFQYEGNLYYKSVKTIDEGEELLVFYGDEFAEATDTKKYFEPVVEKEMVKVYGCGPCCLGFQTVEYLQKHMSKCPYKILNEDSSQGIVQCPFCTLGLTDKKFLDEHKRYCRDRFIRESNYLDNNSLISDPCSAAKRYNCTRCRYQTDSKSHFTTHLRAHDGIKPFECTICNKKFSQKVSLRIHLIKHTGSVDKAYRFKCYQCNYQSNKSSNFKSHMRSHEGVKPFICTICGKTFAQKSNLKEHLATHSEEKPFRCNECQYSCHLKKSLIHHIKDKHSMEKEFLCDFCSYRCVTRSCLMAHLKVHTGERPFECGICNKRFKQKNTLKRHQQSFGHLIPTS